MEIKEIPVGRIKPYENNAKLHPEYQVEKIANSIKRFGFKQPLVVDKHNVLVIGHGRLLAAKALGLKAVPCVKADDLTEQEINALRLADNKTAESGWDFGILATELDGITDIDMSDFGFDLGGLPDDGDEWDVSGPHDLSRLETDNKYNLDILNYENLERTDDFWQMPIIHKQDVMPTRLIPFDNAMPVRETDCGVSFYIDDYKFERIWNSPERYIEIFNKYECILSPDFSLYYDMPNPMKIWNIYRNRFIGAYYQAHGVKVIPSISFNQKDTLDFAFKGIEKGSTVAFSTMSIKRDKELMEDQYAGLEAMIKEIEPEKIICYGGKIDFDYHGIPVTYFDWARDGKNARR